MRAGIMGYGVATGLGVMTHEFRKHLGVESQLLIPNDDRLELRLDWVKDCRYQSWTWEPEEDLLRRWINDKGRELDIVVSIETPYGPQTFARCQRAGAKVVLIVMWEWFMPTAPYQSVNLYVCPSAKAFEQVPFDNKMFLPWPVDTEAIPFRHRTGKAKTFVHNAGTGGIGGRKGTIEAIQAFLKADSDAKLIVRAQVPGDWEAYIGDRRIEIRPGSVPNLADLYAEGDVLIYPAKYDGHSMVVQEGMCAGMPVITTDAAPMNEFASPNDPLLVRVGVRTLAGTLNRSCMANHVDPDDLAAKIVWCTEHDMSEISARNRKIIEEEYSWTVLKQRWIKMLEDVSRSPSPASGHASVGMF